MNPTKRQLESNVWKLSVIRVVRSMMFVMPIIVLFFQENGLTMREIFLLQSIFAIAVLALEIPSGYFADVIGRKQAVLIATFFGALGFTLYALAYGFWGLLAAELLLALGSSFMSGADTSLLYDSLKSLKREGDYKKVFGRISANGNFSEAAAAVAGGFLAAISLRTPVYVEAVIMFFAIPIALTLYEPARKKLSYNNPMQKILQITKFALHGNQKIKWLLVYGAIVGSSTLTAVWFLQPYFRYVGVPIALFGILWAALTALTGVFSLYVHRIESYLGRRKSLLILPFFIFGAYATMALTRTYWLLWIILAFAIGRVFFHVVLDDYINKLVKSEIRATVLSVKAFTGKIPFIVLGPLLGWVMDIYTLPIALAASGLTFLALSLMSLVFVKAAKAY